MSIEYNEKAEKKLERIVSESMRKHCQRPGKRDSQGKMLYKTEQSHKKECDISHIIKKYDKTGLLTHVSRMEARYGDVSGADYKAMADQVAKAKSDFELLPGKIRKYFQNDPGKLLEFMENPANREKAIELGLISKKSDPDKDGLGEHVK